MGKRFTETTKWDDPWYRKLPCKYRNFWQYLLDKCDNAGVWIKDFELAGFCIGETIDEVEALRLINTEKERIKVLNGGSRWLIVDFVSFQFGKLNPESRVHKSIIDLQEKHENKGYPKGINTLKDKNKNKDKDKEKEKDNNKAKFLDYVLLTNEEYDKLVKLFGKDSTDKRIYKLNNYLGSSGKKYKSHYHTILKWNDMEQEKTTGDATWRKL